MTFSGLHLITFSNLCLSFSSATYLSPVEISPSACWHLSRTCDRATMTSTTVPPCRSLWEPHTWESTSTASTTPKIPRFLSVIATTPWTRSPSAAGPKPTAPWHQSTPINCHVTQSPLFAPWLLFPVIKFLIICGLFKFDWISVFDEKISRQIRQNNSDFD